ncbi:hypothetical protein K7X08_024727 [Anisodus acutangulus]|uniref:Aminotransferase-like plant mobile domain-containing protein n=1 Tax=Anisodus acutangulus TaxID=402998 RepID=A0A9Q1RFZ6_9SOLA|nr:hypothetical protein K7X08_024727 [Anisodus acutangulus]
MLKQHFKEVDDNNAEFAARAWILCCLDFLFPNTDSTLNHHLLPFLKDFNKVDGYACDAALHAYLFSSLTKFKQNVEQSSLCGMTHLILLFAYERLPRVREIYMRGV